jgi:peptidoglycan-N-acetylglucosamine deacetylase
VFAKAPADAVGHDAAVSFRRPRTFRLWLCGVPLVKAVGLVLFFSGHPALAAVVFFSPAPWLVWQYLVPTSRGFGPAIRRFRTDRREVWLTIDDGPDPATTPRVLDLLEKHQALATFFLVGENAAAHPALVEEIVRRGHTLGNHTHTHPQTTYWCAGGARTGREIDRCSEAIRARTGSAPRWFRPPVGLKSLALHPALAARGLELVLWSARGYDTKTRSPAGAVRRILCGLKPGAIILAHESGPAVSQRLPVLALLLEKLREERFTCIVPQPAQLLRE